MTDISSINPINDGSIKHYTPTTEWVITGWMKARASDGITADIAFEEINRWLSEMKAEAYENATRALTIGPVELIEIRAEAWEVGKLACLDTHHLPVEDSKLPRNPYRPGETEHTHTRRSSFGDPYCKTCGIDLEGEEQ